MAPVLVQSASAIGTSATTLTITLGSATTAGNCLVVCIGAVENTDNPTVSGITLGGSAGNFAAANTAYSNTYVNAAIWTDPGCAGGQTSIVITLAGGTGASPSVTAWAMEWSGLATSSAVDKAPAGTNATGSPAWSTASTGTLSQASEVAIGVVNYIASGTLTTPGSPWTGLSQLTGTGSDYVLGVGYQVVSSTTALTYSGTASSSGAYGACIVTLKASTSTPVAEADAGGAADQVTAQITSIPVVLITAPRRAAGPLPPPVRAQVFTVPQGSAMPADTAGGIEAMTAGTVTVSLADAGGAADFSSGGIMPQDQAGAAEAMTVTAVSTSLADQGAASDLGGNVSAVQAFTSDSAGAADASQTTGLTQPDAAGAADKIAASVAVAFTDRGAGSDAVGQEPAIGASGGATRPCAMPGTSQVAVAPPGSQQWVFLGSIGQVTALTYSFTCPGGCDSMTCTVMVPASYRNQAFSPGWQVRVWRGGHICWAGKMDEPVPTASGWNFTAVGNGMRGADFLAIYTDTWPANQPDESINGAISRGLPWVNPGVGTPAGAWYGQSVDSGAQNITALLTLLTTRGGLTWYVNSQPGGAPGDDLSVFPLPIVPNRLLICVTPVPRTLGGDINVIYLRYQISADTTTTSGDGSSVSVPAVYGLTSAQNAQSVAMHGELEQYADLSDAGIMTATQAQEVGQAILQVYQRASFAGPFVGNYGALCNMGGTPVDPGTDQASSVVRLILTDFSPGAELVAGPVQFVVGAYSWDDFAQTFTITPYQALDQSITGMLSMESVLLTPITVAST